MRWLTVLSITIIIGACSPSAPNKFSDPVLIKIYDLKDHRSTDSLLFYLNSENPLYRKEAASALASVQDSLASLALGNILLEDSNDDVRAEAAFALGQTGGYQAVNALIPALQDMNHQVGREVLEALGKSIEKKDLNILREFQASDTVLEAGLSWAFYRLALRNKSDSTITAKEADFLNPSYSYATRLGASSYFGRSSKLTGHFEEALIKAALQDVRPEIRLMAVAGLKNLPVEKTTTVLETILRLEKDYRVRISAIRVCQNFPLNETNAIVFGGLRDSVEMVQVAASEVIRNLSDRYPMKRIAEDLAMAKSWRVKSNLYGALLKSLPADKTVDEIIAIFPGASVYFKSGLLSALGEAKAPLNRAAFNFISTELRRDTNALVIRTSASSAIISLDRKAKGSIPRKEFLDIYKQALVSLDPAIIFMVTSALTDTTLHYKKEVADIQFLYQAKAKLILPKDNESLESLESAIAFLDGRDRPKPRKNDFNHPIKWDRVRKIPVGQRVEIRTTRGLIVLRLFVEEAPGSVVNFAELTSAKYFDGKFFHRVVPNFVIQAGCNRGDGFGSEDYSIRSEFSRRRYATGSVGMASSGKDTEGTQWFITHSPTPHLDGRYTLFAEVEGGMDAVHRLEVGDRIVEVKLLD